MSTDNAMGFSMEPSLDVPAESTLHTSPCNTATASEDFPTCGNDSTCATTRDSCVTSPHEASNQGSYSTDLYRAFPKVSQKAKNGAQFCHAVSAFITERAALESTYAQALLKLAQNAKAEDWSEQLTQCWATYREAMEHLAQERGAFASTLQTAIAPGAKAFAAQQEIQVQRLIAEGTKMRWARQQTAAAMDKAKEKYDRKCQEAIDIAATMRKSDTMLSPDVNSSSSDSSSDEVPASKELTDKLAAGAGQLLTKMWDTTSAFGRNSLERQRSKLYTSLEEVIAAEKHYLQTVEYTNAQRLIVERKIKENLYALQLTEEQRLEYLRHVLVRMQKAFIDMVSRSQQFVMQMKTSVHKVNELADIEKCFQNLGSQEEVDVDEADLSINPFYLRITHIQAMSDDGQRMIKTINSVVTELIACEYRFAQSLHKLLRTHETGGVSPSTDLFSTSSNVHTNISADEGPTMTKGWMTLKDQIQLLLEVHQEFKSLLAEPVALSLDTMMKEYESVRTSTQESFLKLHSTLCSDTIAHRRLQQKLDMKSRDFAMGYSYLPGSTPVSTNSYGIDVEQALKVLSANTRSFNEKERRSEAKLRQVAEDIRLLQTRLTESTSALRQTYQTYVQEIEMFISTYMKSEKYRLQVGKNSLQSLAKAIEHMLRGGTSIGNKALVEFEKIDPSEDMAEFIQTNRRPYERSKRVVAIYYDNDSLKAAMREYLASPGTSISTVSENTDKFPRSPMNGSSSPVSSNDVLSLLKKKSPRASAFLAGVHATLTKDDVASESVAHDDEMTSSGTEQDEEFAEAQPLGVSDFQKKFKVVELWSHGKHLVLDSPEQVVESFSCALLLSNFPFHGRLYLTRNRMCFSGWRDTIFVASFSEIVAMEKKNAALIVPNAIKFTISHGEKVFFTSFVYRDECFQSIQQLCSIKKETEALMSDPAQVEESEPLDDDNESKRRRSSDNLAAVAPSCRLVATDIAHAAPVEDRRYPSSSFSDSAALTEALVIPEKDDLLNEFDLLLDDEVAFSVETAFSTLWIESDTFSRHLLDASGSTSISLPPWEKKSVSYTAVNKPDTFDACRLVSYMHHKKYMVGPSVIPTSQTQRYAYTPRSRLIVSTTTIVSEVPYCDYFRVEHRWVFSATNKPNVSLVQVGLRVQWLKSTWLKKQIESATVSEAKDVVKAWLSAALDITKQQVSTKRSSAAIGTSSAEPSLSAETQEDSSSKLQPQYTAVTSPPATASVHAEPTSIIASSTQFQSTLQKAIIVCMLVFVYTMYRVCAAMDQMQALTQESLVQQRQQYELLKQVLEKLNSR